MNNQQIDFENRFKEELIEVIAITGASGCGAGRFQGDTFWRASIKLIAWKDLNSDNIITEKEVSLRWLADDKHWKETKSLLQANTIVKLQVRMGETEMMLIKVVKSNIQDEELKTLLDKSLEPIYYNDDHLGQFELDKTINWFTKEINWLNTLCSLHFDKDENEEVMKSALEIAYTLFDNQKEWDTKIRDYAAKELLELANDWSEEDEEITKEEFIEKMIIESIEVRENGEFQIFFADGDMFAGHSIIVSGNIIEGPDDAQMAG